MKLLIQSLTLSLLLFSLVINAAPNPMIESFTIVPGVCVVAREDNCKQDIRFLWQLSYASDSCLFLAGEEKPLYCSYMQPQSSIVLTLNVKKDNEFIIRLMGTSDKEMRRRLIVRELGKDVRQSRRHLWSVF